MSKILLALSILSAGAGGFMAARQSTVEFQREANTARESWQMETQWIATAQSQQASLKEYQEDLRRSLRQRRIVVVDPVWSELQANLSGQLTRELREKLLHALDFNWQSSPDYIVITKQALRETGPRWIVQNGKCTDEAVSVFTMTPGARAQVEAVWRQAQTESDAWTRDNVDRSDPDGNGDMVAIYTVRHNPSIGTNFFAAISQALGADRAKFFLNSEEFWMFGMDGSYSSGNPTQMAIRRFRAGNEVRVKVLSAHWPDRSKGFRDLWDNVRGDLVPFPEVYRPLFPNGWSDVAKREGFELPKGLQK